MKLAAKPVYTCTLCSCSDPHELSPALYGVNPGNMETVDVTGLFHGYHSNQHLTVDELIGRLEKEYCDTIAAEFQHLDVCKPLSIYNDTLLKNQFIS